MDCPFTEAGTDHSKILVVLDHDTAAALALFQTPASSRQEAFEALEEVLDGGRWESGHSR